MKKLLAILFILPVIAFSQKENYDDQDYIRQNAIESLELIHFSVNNKDYRFAGEFLILKEGANKEAALKDLIANDDFTSNGIKALSESAELVPFNNFRNEEAIVLARDLELDLSKCWALRVPSEMADCWFYFDGLNDRLLFFKLRNIRVKE